MTTTGTGDPDPELPVTAGFGLAEVLVAVVILSFGMLAVAGMTLGVARQTASSSVRTDQALAAQQVLEATVGAPYGTYPPGTRETLEVTLEEHTYRVTRQVFSATPRVDSVRVIVSGAAGLSEDTFRTRIYRPHPPPTVP